MAREGATASAAPTARTRERLIGVVGRSAGGGAGMLDGPPGVFATRSITRVGALIVRCYGAHAMLDESQMLRFNALVHANRSRCLWFLRPDFAPTDPAEIVRVLDLIERSGDVASFQESRRIRAWLSATSSVGSAR